MEIRIDTNEVQTIKETIVSQIVDLEDNINSLLNNVESINNVWSGTDSANFITTYKEKIISNFNNLETILKTYRDDLDVVAKSYDALDDAFSNKSIEV